MSPQHNSLKDLRVLVGITGGIAAYKAVDLASKLTGCGAQVKTILTKNAAQFIGPKSLEAVTGSHAYSGLWDTAEQDKITHVNLADWTDILVVAPATANILAKSAAGICDDLLSTTICTCWKIPTIFAPAMNDRMFSNPAVEQNIKTLSERGAHFIGPKKGRLACGSQATGRMAEPGEIIQNIEKIAPKNKKKQRK